MASFESDRQQFLIIEIRYIFVSVKNSRSLTSIKQVATKIKLSSSQNLVVNNFSEKKLVESVQKMKMSYGKLMILIRVLLLLNLIDDTIGLWWYVMKNVL